MDNNVLDYEEDTKKECSCGGKIIHKIGKVYAPEKNMFGERKVILDAPLTQSFYCEICGIPYSPTETNGISFYSQRDAQALLDYFRWSLNH